jgi:hypothetical protein
MKRILVAALLMALISCAGVAQERSDEKKSSGYVFAAPGAVVTSGAAVGILHFGAGGQGLLYKGLGMGAEIGYLSPNNSLADGVGLLSVNGLYEFKQANAKRKVIPFVTAGYSLAFRCGASTAFNFGGGINYWFREKQALRLEVRDYISPLEPNMHLLTGRIGISFR